MAAALATAAVAVPGAGAATDGGVPAAFAGTWTRTVTAADWRKAGAGEFFPVGAWKIVIKKGGAMDVYTPGASSIDFTSRVTPAAGGRVTIAPFPVCAGKATYRWRVAAGRLAFAKVKDDCGPRIGFLVGAWKKI